MITLDFACIHEAFLCFIKSTVLLLLLWQQYKKKDWPPPVIDVHPMIADMLVIRNDGPHDIKQVCCYLGYLHSLSLSHSPPSSSGSVLDHRSLPPVFESWRGHI